MSCITVFEESSSTGDGSGGDSIYGGKFNDEKNGLKAKHDRLGVVAMANSGKNSNTSQFYITLAESLPQLNGKHVVFGHVVEGLEVLQRIGMHPVEKRLVTVSDAPSASRVCLLLPALR